MSVSACSSYCTLTKLYFGNLLFKQNENKLCISQYLDIRELLLKSINKKSLEVFSMHYFFLKTGRKIDDILERFSTNWLYPNIKCLSINFFENGKQDWCDYLANTLKRHLYGILKTNNIQIVKLVQLENDYFHGIQEFLERLMNTNLDGVRKLSYRYEQGDVATDFIINLNSYPV